MLVAYIQAVDRVPRLQHCFRIYAKCSTEKAQVSRLVYISMNSWKNLLIFIKSIEIKLEIKMIFYDYLWISENFYD